MRRIQSQLICEPFRRWAFPIPSRLVSATWAGFFCGLLRRPCPARLGDRFPIGHAENLSIGPGRACGGATGALALPVVVAPPSRSQRPNNRLLEWSAGIGARGAERVWPLVFEGRPGDETLGSPPMRVRAIPPLADPIDPAAELVVFPARYPLREGSRLGGTHPLPKTCGLP
jgi:hypothetical protein